MTLKKLNTGMQICRTKFGTFVFRKLCGDVRNNAHIFCEIPSKVGINRKAAYTNSHEAYKLILLLPRLYGVRVVFMYINSLPCLSLTFKLNVARL